MPINEGLYLLIELPCPTATINVLDGVSIQFVGTHISYTICRNILALCFIESFYACIESAIQGSRKLHSSISADKLAILWNRYLSGNEEGLILEEIEGVVRWVGEKYHVIGDSRGYAIMQFGFMKKIVFFIFK